MVRMEHDEYDLAVGENVRAALIKEFGSIRKGSQASGIPGASLDRKMRGLSPFNVRELRRVAQLTGRGVASLLPSESKVGA